MQAAPGTYTHGHVSVGMGQTRSGLSGHNCANECLMKEGPDEFDWAAVALGTLRLLTCYTSRARFCVPRMYCIRTAGGRATTLAGRGGAGVRRGRIQDDVWIPEMRLAFWVNFESVSMVDRPAALSPRKGGAERGHGCSMEYKGRGVAFTNTTEPRKRARVGGRQTWLCRGSGTEGYPSLESIGGLVRLVHPSVSQGACGEGEREAWGLLGNTVPWQLGSGRKGSAITARGARWRA